MDSVKLTKEEKNLLKFTIGLYECPDAYYRCDKTIVGDKTKELFKQIETLNGRPFDKNGWEMAGHYPHKKKRRCICGQDDLLTDWIIQCKYTNKKFSVGSSCVERFECTRLIDEMWVMQKTKCGGGNPIIDKRTKNGRVGKCDDTACKACYEQPAPPAPPPAEPTWTRPPWRTFFKIPFDDHEALKQDGFKFDWGTKKWFLETNNLDKIAKYKKLYSIIDVVEITEPVFLFKRK